MAAATERETQTPCGWCGAAIVQPPTGRRLRYCDRSCRQRAYEARTADRRYQRDLGAGRIRQQPAERVVERVVQPRHPSTVAAWVAALDELTERVGDGRVQPWDLSRIRQASSRLQTAVDAVGRSPGDRPSRPQVVPAPVAAGAGGDRLGALAERLAATSAGRAPTTLTRLAGELGVDVDVLRVVLVDLVDADVARLTRTGPAGVEPVDAHTIAEHQRFTVTLTR